MKRNFGKAASIPAGLGISLTITISITIIATVLIAVLLNKETIQWTSIGYWIMAVLLFASFLGGKAAIRSIKTQKYLVSLMSGVLYWMVLLCITALFFGGHYDSIAETGALIIAGSVSAALLQFPQKSYRTSRTKKAYR